MIITRDIVNIQGEEKTVFAICNSIQDTGKEYVDKIAEFRSLEIATIVFRYMNGYNISEVDERRAKRALRLAPYCDDDES